MSQAARLAVAVGFAAVGVTVISAGAMSAQGAGCALISPEANWVKADRDTGSVAVFSADVSAGFLGRSLDDITDAMDLLDAELGGVGQVTVCLFAPQLKPRPEGITAAGQVLHAATLAGPGILAVEALPGTVRQTAGFGLAYLALWHQSGGSGYPEPLASAIGQWYSARLIDRLALHHVTMRRANLYTTGSIIDWTAGSQQETFVWNPQFHETPIGDIVEFAVKERGVEVLATPDAEVWSSIEADWRTQLRVELTGRATPTTRWVVGLGLVFLLLLIAAATAQLRRRAKRKLLVPRSESSPGDFAGPE